MLPSLGAGPHSGPHSDADGRLSAATVPTHSQSLEKLFVGLDNVAAVYISSLMDPAVTVSEVARSIVRSC